MSESPYVIAKIVKCFSCGKVIAVNEGKCDLMGVQYCRECPVSKVVVQVADGLTPNMPQKSKDRLGIFMEWLHENLS